MTMSRTAAPSGSLPAEWECTDPVVIMALPHRDTDWAYMLDDAVRCFRDMIKAIARYARVVVLSPVPDEARALLTGIDGPVNIIETPTNDTWTRDYGVITLRMPDGSNRCLDFTFNAWGMKFAAGLDNRVNRTLDADGFFSHPLSCCKDMVLEGGSIESDGNGTLLVTSQCLLEPNRNPWMSAEEIDRQLRERLGMRKVLWLDHGFLMGDDTDSHIDTLARFAPGRKIVCVECDDPSDPHYEELQLMRQQLATFTDADGQPYEIITLPMADAVYDPDDGIRLPATYANYLALPGVVILPSYDSPEKDAAAAATLRDAYSCEVVAVDCRALLRQHGSLHCSTMQIPLSATRLSDYSK